MKKLIILLMFVLVSCAQTTPALPTKMAVTATLSAEIIPGWTSYGSINALKVVAFDQAGNLWAGGDGGVVQWSKTGSAITYTKDNGLMDNHVLSITVARDSAVWVGTDNGVSRFDGANWQHYTTENGLAGNHTSSIEVAPDGTLWFNSEQGISRFDGKTWAKYTPPGKYQFDTAANSIAIAPDGTLWAGTDENVWHFDGTTWTSYTINDKPENNFTTSIVASPDGTIWVGTLGGGISRFDGKKWTSDTTIGAYILFIAVAPSGTVWAGTAFSVARLDGKTWKNYPIIDTTQPNAIHAIAPATDDTLWLATEKGVVHFDEKSQIAYTTDNGLTDNRVASIVLAPDGTIGAGTEFGVSRFDGKAWASQTAHNGPSSNAILSTTTTSNGIVWVGTENGVARFDGKTWTNYTTSDGLANNRVSALAVASDGALLAGTDNGISRFDGKTWVNYNASDSTGHLAKSVVSSIAIAPDKTVWATTLDGVWHFSGTTWASKAIITFPTIIVTAPDGSLWFGSHGNGVTRLYQNKTTTYTKKDGLADDEHIYFIAAAPDSTIWVATNIGISHFDGTTWTNYSTGDGLAGTYVSAIAITPDGVVWFGTNNGVSRFDGATWANYTTSDGLPSNEVKSIAVAPDGSLWFGTRNGVSHYVPGKIPTQIPGKPQNTNTPKPTVEQTNPPDPIFADCGWSATARAWVDLNGNGVRDASDSPLPGVTFHVDDTLNGYTDVNPGNSPTNGKGESQLSVFLPGCPNVHFEIYPDVPSGYRVLSDARLTADADAVNQVFEFGFSQLTGVPTLTPHASVGSCVPYHLGLSNRYDITDVAVATDGTVWVATFNDGLRKLAAGSSEWITIRASDGLVNNQVRSITALADGSLWFGTQGGASRLDANGWSTFTTTDGLIDNNVYGIAKAPNDDVWFATAGGVSRLDAKTSTWKSLKTTYISKAIAVSPNGVVWASMDMDYLAQIVDSGKDGIRLQNKKGFAFIDQLTFAPDGMLWIAGFDGLSKYDPATKVLDAYNSMTTKGAFEGHARAFALAPDGSVWIAAGNGSPVVYHFLPKLGTATTNAWHIYDERDGIPSLPTSSTNEDNVQALAITSAGDVWIATTEHATLCHFEDH